VYSLVIPKLGKLIRVLYQHDALPLVGNCL
jgi:hypothetical protein